MDFPSRPTADETRYASDLLHGKRNKDLIVIAASAIVGFVCGIVIGFAGSAANEEAPDLALILSCAAPCAFAFAIITGLMLASLRTIVAICTVWMPARVIVGIVCALELLNVGRALSFWLLDPSRILIGLITGALGLMFGILFLTLGLRILFGIYGMVTGKDDEALTAQAIAADKPRKQR